MLLIIGKHLYQKQKEQQDKLGKTLWEIADNLRGAMNADNFRDYMLSFLFLRYLSYNYEESAKKELGKDYPDNTPLDVMSKLKFRFQKHRRKLK